VTAAVYTKRNNAKGHHFNPQFRAGGRERTNTRGWGIMLTIPVACTQNSLKLAAVMKRGNSSTAASWDFS